ncbi:P-loop NTPase fold protein [Clostridium pasteurianum]|uniref:P-loop NTPase fold protein n=1 Tax=Clostridium pasteurianum TaxID=1501 RepID=UPI00155A326B|nr:P-loop NTPase fold protein [Clostridium pasteurianum]
MRRKQKNTLNIDGDEKKDFKMADNPIEKESELFPSRKRQLDYFLSEMKNKKDEPFSVAISGVWGAGKTSFINAFKDKMNKDNFIYIEPKIENKPIKMLEDLTTQFYAVFNKKGIYTGKGSTLRNYFNTIFRILGRKDFNFITDIFSDLTKENNYGYLHVKEKLNTDLLKLIERDSNNYNRFYIIVDDLDRSDDEVKLNTLSFIKEIVNLKGCTVIFLVDYEKLQSDTITNEFLDKFINDRYELGNINLNEIVEYFYTCGLYLNESFFLNKSNKIKTIATNLKNDIIKFFTGITEELENFIYKYKEIEEDGTEEKQAYYKQLLREQQNLLLGLCNPRKVKKFYRELERILTLFEIRWFSDEESLNNELSNSKWDEIAFNICFIKIFYEKEFDKLVKSNNIDIYIDNNKNFVTQILLKQNLSIPDNEKHIYNMILYKLFLERNPVEIKTENQKIRDELRNNELKESNISKYLQEVILKYNYNNRYEDFKKIVSYVSTIKDKDIVQQYIVEIFKQIEDASRFNRTGLLLLYIKHTIKTFIDDISNFNGKIKSQFVYLMEHIQNNFIWGLSGSLTIIIQTTNLKDFSYNYVKNKYVKQMNNIEDFYNVLYNVNEEIKIYSFNHNEVKVLEIEAFLKKIKDYLYGNKNLKNINNLIQDYFKEVEESIELIKYINLFNVSSIGNTTKSFHFDPEFNFKGLDNLENEVKDALHKISVYIKDKDNIEEQDDVYKYFASLCQVVEDVYTIENVKLFEKYDIYRELDKIYEEVVLNFNNEIPKYMSWLKYTKLRIERIKQLYPFHKGED